MLAVNLDQIRKKVRSKTTMISDISSIMMRLEDQGYFDQIHMLFSNIMVKEAQFTQQGIFLEFLDPIWIFYWWNTNILIFLELDKLV